MGLKLYIIKYPNEKYSNVLKYFCGNYVDIFACPFGCFKVVHQSRCSHQRIFANLNYPRSHSKYAPQVIFEHYITNLIN